MNTAFKGVISALVTPFDHQGVDYASLEKLVQFQLDNGINGFVVNGTTAESPTLTSAEVKKIFSVVRALAGVRVPLILGTGSNCTAKTVEDTRMAFELGADAALVVVPYYNKPPQRGLIEHFRHVAKETDGPILLYNVPGRTITGMTEDTILQLSEVKNIAGLKEASGDMTFGKSLRSKLKKDFIFLSGDDGTYIDFLELGGNGIISVMSNLIPAESVEWTRLTMTGSLTEARASFAKFKKLIDGMYVEANPIPVKWMLHKMGLIKSPETRLPLMALDEKYHASTLELMGEAGLI